MKLIKQYNRLALGLLIVILNCTSALAQQTASFPEYNFNPFIINAAYAGLLPSTEATLANTGFSEFEGAPKNFYASLHLPLNDGKMGLGAAIQRDEIGVTKSTNTFVASSYKIFFDFKDDRPYWQNYQPSSLSFGLTVGLQQFQDDLLALNIMDDINFSQNINATIPTIGAGFLFNYSSFYAGISAPNLIGTSLASDGAIKLEFPIYGYFGYRFYNDRFENFMFKPSLFLKHEKGAPILADLNMSISYRNRFELGAGYRTNSSFNVLAGIYLLKSFRLIYHYNMATNNYPLGNAHGLVLSCRFGQGYPKR